MTMNSGELNPGESVQIDNISQIALFEDMVADRIYPGMTTKMREAWQHRPAFKDLMRPPGFNSNMTDIELVVMDSPFERLLDAKGRGWAFGRAFSPERLREDDAAKDSFRGFTFLANARRMGRITGQVQTEFWIGEAPSRMREFKRTSAAGAPGIYRVYDANAYRGASVRRIMAIPKLEEENFLMLPETAKRIGFEALREQMSHPPAEPTGE